MNTKAANIENLSHEDGDEKSDTQIPENVDPISSLKIKSSVETVTLKHGASSVVAISSPVCSCMTLVVCAFGILEDSKEQSESEILPYTPFYEKDASTATLVWQTVANAFILTCVIIFATVLLVLLYKYKCKIFVQLYMILITIVLTSFVGLLFAYKFVSMYNLIVDWISIVLIFLNIAVTSVVLVHFKGPLLGQQIILIIMSALIALEFEKRLPNWTAWVILAVVSIYDLVAVLAPFGPLRILLNMASERNEELFPGLIYTTGMIWVNQVLPSELIESNDASSKKDSKDTSNKQAVNYLKSSRVILPSSRQPVSSDKLSQNSSNLEVNNGIKLGLGDFIFYSLLIAKATSSQDFVVIISCYVAIIVGLILTLFLLSVFKKALPALPFSISLGLFFYFTFFYAVRPFVDMIAAEQVFL